MPDDPKSQLVSMTTDIVSAYVNANSVQAGDIPALIASVHSALSGISTGTVAPQQEPAPTKATAAQIRKSITPDALISFVDGRSYRTLKRHLTTHGMTVQDYKKKFGLPADYPTTAPSYSAARSEVAKSRGLGRTVRKRSEPAPTPVKPPRKTRAKPKEG